MPRKARATISKFFMMVKDKYVYERALVYIPLDISKIFRKDEKMDIYVSNDGDFVILVREKERCSLARAILEIAMIVQENKDKIKEETRETVFKLLETLFDGRDVTQCLKKEEKHQQQYPL